MNSTHLSEHDANQGAQSSGEFLGMTGNSGWFLLGSGGATILMVIFLWGILGVSLLLCLFVGFALCLGSVVYVFALKNNKPEHYDTDFFESALVEAGVMQFAFGPRVRRPRNPFLDVGADVASPSARETERSPRRASSGARSGAGATRAPATAVSTEAGAANASRENRELMVAKTAYDELQEKLTNTEELLQDMLAEAVED